MIGGKQILEQKQSLKQKLSFDMIQKMNLLSLSNIEIEKKIKDEIEENPALEEVSVLSNNDDLDNIEKNIDDETTEITLKDVLLEEDSIFFNENEFDDDITPVNYTGYKLNQDNKNYYYDNLTEKDSFQQTLIEQISYLKIEENEKNIIEILVGFINKEGYIEENIYEISLQLLLQYNLKVSAKKVEKLIKEIQKMDPPGVGARNIQERLLLQLERKEKSSVNELSKIVIKDYFEDFIKKRYDKIIESIKIDRKDFLKICEEIKRLKFQSFEDVEYTENYTIIPDFILFINEDKIDLILNNNHVHEVVVKEDLKKEYYKNSKKPSEQDKKDINKFIKTYKDKAVLFVNALDYREKTMLKVMKAIICHQKEFFLKGETRFIKTMSLKDIARETDTDISTISRAINNKYVQTPFGIVSLKSLFIKDIHNQSVIQTKDIIKQIIETEDNTIPYTDGQIEKILKQEGFQINRRTIAKYRQDLKILSAKERKDVLNID